MIDLATQRLPDSLYSRRLTIRRPTVSDAPELHEAARISVAEIYPWLPWCHPDYAIEETWHWIEQGSQQWREGTGYAFVIRDRWSDEVFGACGLSELSGRGAANLGYWIKTPAIGRGIASEAAIAVARFGLEHLDLLRIEIVMSAGNIASRRVAENAGGVYEGRLRNRLYLHGDRHDAFVYSIIPPL